MTKLLIIAATLSFAAAPAAFACDVHAAGTHAKVDDTTVASVATGETRKMSTAETSSTVVIKDESAQTE